MNFFLFSFPTGSCEAVSKLIGSTGKDVLYVGDHIFGDIIKSKKQKAWRTMLVVPELNHELKVFHEKRELFNTLEELDTSISELLRSFDMTSNERPDAVKKIKLKIQVSRYCFRVKNRFLLKPSVFLAMHA